MLLHVTAWLVACNLGFRELANLRTGECKQRNGSDATWGHGSEAETNKNDEREDILSRLSLSC
jgi:hypothetical protein